MTEKRNINNTATIDGHEVIVRKEITILDAAQKAGIYIPTLCHLENLEPYGGCRLCVVDVKNMKGFPTACTTPIKPGMEISTRTPELQKLRSEILEFSLSEHPFTCLVCKDKRECADFMHSTRKVSTITGCNFCTSNGDCELQDLVDYLELKDVKFPITYRGIPPVKDNPFYDLDYNLCVLCGRCVRICNEERNSNVLAFVERGNSTIVGTAFQESQKEAGCEYCGACVDVCPTGSISEKMGKWRGIPDKTVKTTCVICPVACEMNVNTSKGQLVQIGPQPGKRTSPPQLCLRGKFLPADLNQHPSRITTPLVKKEGGWVEVTWKAAFDLVASKLDNLRGTKFGLITSGQDTLEDNYTLQKFVRTVMQSNNIDTAGSHSQKEVPELLHGFYSQHPPVGMDRIEKTDTLLVIGLDASLSHPMLENQIRKAFQNGKNVIYASSYPTRTSTFITGEIHYDTGDEDHFLSELLTALNGKPSSRSSKSIPEKVVSILRNAKELSIIAGDDLLRHPSAVDNLKNLFNLHHIISRKHPCHILFPGLEGGWLGTVLSGVHPDYLPGLQKVAEEKWIQKWNGSWDAQIGTTKGWSCNEMVHQIQKGKLTSMMVMGDLPVHPDLSKLDFLVQCNMFKTGLSEVADVLLPVTDFLENEGHILSLEGKVKKVKRCVSPPGDVKSIPRILSGLATAMGTPGFSSKPADIYREFRSEIGFPVKKVKGVKTEIQPVRIKKHKRSEDYPVRLTFQHNYFTYKGNRLTELVPELSTIAEEGVIGLAEIMMSELNVQDGELVRIITAHGESSTVCRTMSELEGNSACLFPNGNDALALHGGLVPYNSILNARIEKIKTKRSEGS